MDTKDERIAELERANCEQEKKILRLRAERAAEWQSRAERVRDRIDRGLAPFHGDGAWLAWYDRTTARVRALVVEDGE